MHDVVVAIDFSRVFDANNWRALSALARAMWAARVKHNYKAALAHCELAMSVDRMRTSEHMAFYALLMMMNRLPGDQHLKLFKRVAAGEFRCNSGECRYAEAYANYTVAFLTRRADVIERWLDALKLKPTKGFAVRNLSLPNNPIDPSERHGKVAPHVSS